MEICFRMGWWSFFSCLFRICQSDLLNITSPTQARTPSTKTYFHKIFVRLCVCAFVCLMCILCIFLRNCVLFCVPFVAS